MDAKEIRNSAHKLLNHACSNCNNKLAFSDTIENIKKVLELDSSTFDKVQMYLITSNMLSKEPTVNEGRISIELTFTAINWVADFEG